MDDNIWFNIFIVLLATTLLLVFALLIVGGCRLLFNCVTEFMDEIKEWKDEH